MTPPGELEAMLLRAERAVQAAPRDANAHGRLGTLLIEAARAALRDGVARGRDRSAQAQALYRRALASLELATGLNPGSAQALRYAAFAHRELGDLDQAERALAAALQIDPGDADTAVELAFVHQCLGRTAAAIQGYRAVIARRPDHANAHASLALSLLGAGDYERGWPEYEWRLRLPDTIYRPYPFPFWRGEPLEGKRILICSEQGIGDEVMFASCYQEIIDRAAECFIECSTRLVSLFSRSFPRARVFARSLRHGPDWKSLPAFDFHVPGGSLPLQLRTRLQHFSRPGAYLAADEARVRHWRARLEDALGPGRKVGLAWTGGVGETLRAARSLPLADLQPLFRVEGVKFVSLEFVDSGPFPPWWPEATRNVDESAALVSALDLVISVTTAIAHVAGATGTPLWIVIPRIATWRYGWSGESLPWYPHARVFRGAGDTGALVARIAGELGA